MLGLLRTPLHHSEAIDPTLVGWIRDEIDHLLGLEPATIAILLGIVILAFPLWLAFSVLRHREAVEPHPPADQRPSSRFGVRD